tara:strand:+ start:230 stop:505 length:276 start_codon:yes stop_codon:yes gene_type:complete
MSKLERKINRKKMLKRKKEAKKEMASKIESFSRLPNNCLVCEKGYDKKSKEMASKWYVVQHKENVRLYCPDCWEVAANIIKDYAGEKSNKE